MCVHYWTFPMSKRELLVSKCSKCPTIKVFVNYIGLREGFESERTMQLFKIAHELNSKL